MLRIASCFRPHTGAARPLPRRRTLQLLVPQSAAPTVFHCERRTPTSPFPCIGYVLRRFASTSRSYGDGVQTVARAVDRETAEVLFEEWAKTAMLSGPPSRDKRRLTLYYLPVWSFYAASPANLPSLRDRRVHIGITYAGSAFPRTLLSSVLHTNNCAPLPHDTSSSNPHAIPDNAIVEPFATYESTAWQRVKDTYLQRADTRDSLRDRGLHPDSREAVEGFSNIQSHRIYVPVYVVEYSFFGQPLRAFIDACWTFADEFAEGRGRMVGTARLVSAGGRTRVHGVQQTLFPAGTRISEFLDKGIVDAVGRGVQIMSRLLGHAVRIDPRAVVLLASGLSSLLRPLAKVIMYPPFLVGSAFAFAGFSWYRIMGGVRAQAASFRQWEEQRAAERRHQQAAGLRDEWRYKPKIDFAEQARRAAAQETERQRAQQEQQRQQQQQQQQQQAERERASRWSSATRDRERQQEQARQRERDREKEREREEASRGARAPPLRDPKDHYEVLGLEELGPAADLAAIQTAFRKQLMRFHPDQQSGRPDGYSRDAATERTRLIIESYGVLRDKTKRAAYDATYRRRR